MFTALFEIITVGYPFCAFKILAGLALGQTWLVFWGVLDTAINTANLIALLFRRHVTTETCLLSLIVRTLKKPSHDEKPVWRELGNSLDALLSFVIVAAMLGGGFLKLLTAAQLLIWNISVILNVLGAGTSRLSGSVAALRRDS